MGDLIKTIEDDDEPEDLSEDSDSDDEFQPTRKRSKATKASGFEPSFDFSEFAKDVISEKIGMLKKDKETHSKLKELTKRTTLDEKIKSKRKRQAEDDEDEAEIKEESESEADSEDEDEESDSDMDDDIESDNSMSTSKKPKPKSSKKGQQKSITVDDDIDLSDDELQEDEIRVKDKKGRKGTKAKNMEQIDNGDLEDYEKLEDDTNFQTDLSFQQMNLSRPLLKSITSLGFTSPTPIQAAAIPIALAGRDICGCAATGTGKTAAYMLPVLERLLYKPKTTASTRVLCLVPTRELGVQVFNVTRQLASFSSNIQIGLAVGGLDMQGQEAILRQNPDIVIATPGRLIDHLGNTPSFTLDSIEILILDEADRMLDDWFAQQLKEIVRQFSPRRQTLLFSATMTDRVKDLAAVSLKNPSKIFVDSNKQVAFNLRQQFVRIRNESDREAILCSLVVRTFHSRTMVFVPTKKTAHRLHILLGLLSIRIGELHGDMAQAQRLEALKKFQNNEVDVLIVTDVAARGLDIPGVLIVLNYIMPPTLEQYIHRCGRTARAGRSGLAVSLVGEQDRKLMKQVAKSATQPVKARIIPLEMIAKYRDKVKNLEPEIESIAAEEEAEKSIAKAEIEANKALKMLDAKKAKKKAKKQGAGQGASGGAEGADGKRVWFQSHSDREKEKTKLKGRGTPKDRDAQAKSDEDFKLRKMQEFQSRVAKRKRRNQARDTARSQDGGGAGGKGKGKKKKSHFETELTNVKAARQFRHQSKASKPTKPQGGGGGGRAGGGGGGGGGFTGKITIKKRR